MRLFDLHCDTLRECYLQGKGLYSNDLHIDLSRGCALDAWGQLFAVFVPDDLRGEAAFDYTAAVLNNARRMERERPEQLHFLSQGEPLPDSFPPHTCLGILTVESGAALAGSLSHLYELAELGVKVITLTWNGENELGFGAGCDKNAPLKPFGKAAVREMERLHIAVDVSHLNERGFWDVAECTNRPFIASHSVSAAVHPHPRNLTDEQFDEIVRRGGLVGLNMAASQLGGASFEQIERHLAHYLSRGGEKTVAFGCDFDGTDLPPEWGGIEVMTRLYDYLLSRGYAENLLSGLFFENAEKVWRNL